MFKNCRALFSAAALVNPKRSFKALPISHFALSFPVQHINIRQFSSVGRAGKVVKPGEAIVVDGDPHKVQKITQGKRGKGGGFVRGVLKNLVSGQVFEKTFTSDETVTLADLEKEVFQYSWSDGESFSFMNSRTFEEVQVAKDDIELWEFLVEGQEVKLLKFREKVIGVELPNTFEYEVMTIDETKSRLNSNQHWATLNSGAELFVPQFIHAGMKIKVNVHEKEYVEKASTQ